MNKPLGYLLVLALFVSLPLIAAYAPEDGLNKLLSEYVKNGRPHYKALKDRGGTVLDTYLKSLAKFDPANLKTDSERTAFWINVYNAFAMKLVSESYPAGTDIFKVRGFFDLKKVNVGGREYTLNDILDNELKMGAESKDPRINFAVSNGAKSSPRLNPRAFDPRKIDSDLEECTKRFLNDPANVYLTEVTEDEKGKPLPNGPVPKVMLSWVFKYFEPDFGRNRDEILEFVAKYAPEKDSAVIKKRMKDIKVDYIPYDWSFDGF